MPLAGYKTYVAVALALLKAAYDAFIVKDIPTAINEFIAAFGLFGLRAAMPDKNPAPPASATKAF